MIVKSSVFILDAICTRYKARNLKQLVLIIIKYLQTASCDLVVVVVDIEIIIDIKSLTFHAQLTSDYISITSPQTPPPIVPNTQ